MVKVGWDKKTVAIYELIFFAAHLLSFAWSTGVNNALLAYFPTLEGAKKKVLLFNVMLLMFTFSIVIAAIFWIFQAQIMNGLTDHANLPYADWIILFLICSPSSILVQAIYLLSNEPHKITRYTHWIFTLQLIIVTIAILAIGSVKALVIGITLWSVIKFLYLIWISKKYTLYKFDFNLYRVFLWFALPLIFQFVLSNGMEYVDGIIVNQYFEVSSFPVFRYGAKELPITIILVISLTSAMIPLAVQNLKGTLAQIKERTRKLMHILFPLSSLLILVSPYLYQWIYSSAYIASAQLFNIYLLILLARIILPQVILYAQQRNGVILFFTMLELLLNVGLSIWWTEPLGLAGIAYATVIANIFYSLMLTIYAHLTLGVKPSAYIPIRTYLVYVTMLLAVFAFSVQVYNYG